MKYSEIKKQLQSLQKRAHDAAKGLPKNLAIITEIKECAGEETFYTYYLQVWNVGLSKPASPLFSGNIYEFWTDDKNRTKAEHTLLELLQAVEQIKQAKQ